MMNLSMEGKLIVIKRYTTRSYIIKLGRSSSHFTATRYQQNKNIQTRTLYSTNDITVIRANVYSHLWFLMLLYWLVWFVVLCCSYVLIFLAFGILILHPQYTDVYESGWPVSTVISVEYFSVLMFFSHHVCVKVYYLLKIWTSDLGFDFYSENILLFFDSVGVFFSFIILFPPSAIKRRVCSWLDGWRHFCF